MCACARVCACACVRACVRGTDFIHHQQKSLQPPTRKKEPKTTKNTKTPNTQRFIDLKRQLPIRKAFVSSSSVLLSPFLSLFLFSLFLSTAFNRSILVGPACLFSPDVYSHALNRFPEVVDWDPEFLFCSLKPLVRHRLGLRRGGGCVYGGGGGRDGVVLGGVGWCWVWWGAGHGGHSIPLPAVVPGCVCTAE